jgi:GntR family transcriptional repressor for pyruvate dehydrogenase complex
MPFTPITPPPRFRLADAVYEQLEKMVVSGALSADQSLPSERDLAQQVGVSRPLVREALSKLESRGLIVVRTGGGYRVANACAPWLADPLGHLMAGHEKTAADVLEMREVLETMSVELATMRASAADLEKLEAAVSALEQAFSEQCAAASGEPGDPALDRLVELDARFHMALAEATHNVVLAHTMHAIFGLIRGSVERSYRAIASREQEVGALVRQHRAIFAAVASRDPQRARAAVTAHLELVKRGTQA